MADVSPVSEQDPNAAASGDVRTLPVERLFANPDQPRRRFGANEMEELVASVKEKGIIQPLIVRPMDDGGYEIVAGERRWRAAQQAQLHEVPVLIREFDDTEVLEIAIIENIQRADLNAIEEAAGYRQLMDKFGHTQEKLAEALGKSRSHIANLLRLLTLPEDVLDLVRSGQLSGGHGRALVTAENPAELARKVIKEGLSVRATEALVSRKPSSTQPKTSTPKSTEKDADTMALEGDLSASLGMPVRLSHKTGQESGTVSIDYKSLDQLDELCRLLSAT